MSTKCFDCGKEMIDAGHGIGYFCENPECNKPLTPESYDRLVANFEKTVKELALNSETFEVVPVKFSNPSSHSSCQICGSTDKKALAKYCWTCKKMIEKEWSILNKGIWKQAIEIVRKKVQSKPEDGRLP